VANQHTLFKFGLLTTRDTGYEAGDIVKCVWDDIDEAIKVYVYDGPTDLFGTLMITGPSLGIPGPSFDYTVTEFGYKFCDGTTLNYFQYNAGVFPYAIRQTQADSIACQTVLICDLQIADNPVLTPASDTATNDGTATISASGTNGDIKIAAYDFDYATEGDLLIAGSYTFSALYAGPYTFYVKDASGCADTITVTIPLADSYGEKYFLEWTDFHGENNNGFDHKIQIYQRSYSGAVSELRAGAAPIFFKVQADAEDKFKVIRATTLRFQVVALTEGQCREFFTEDDREYLIKHSLNSGAGYQVDWLGYINPFLYSEAYLKEPYYVDIEATCGLAQLKEIDFVDASGNNFKGTLSAMEIISGILKKLDLSINIRSGINLYENTFDQTDTDDPLKQAYYDTSVYYTKGDPEKCDVVLKNILQDYSAAISLADGKWIIWRPEEISEAFDYREFTSAGAYSSNGSIDPVLSLSIPGDTDRVFWKDALQTLSTIKSYGTFEVVQKLIPKVSLLPSFSFEIEDLIPFGFGKVFFKGWNIAITNGGATWGWEEVSRGDSLGALSIKFQNILDADGISRKNEVLLYTINNAFATFTSQDVVRFKFDYFINTNKTPREWMRIKYKIKIGDYYYNTLRSNLNAWTTTDVGYNELYTTSFNSWESIEVLIKDDNMGTFDFEDKEVQVYFIVDNQVVEDYDDFDLMKAETTVDRFAGIRRIVKLDVPIAGTFFVFYELRENTEEEVGTILGHDMYLGQGASPDDWDVTNPKAWYLTSKIKADSLKPSNGILFDNVVVEVLPGGLEPQESITYTVINNPRNKQVYTLEIFHGDCPTTITNAKYAYKNFIKDENGDPTSAWTRDGFSESDLIQKILLRTLIAQFRKFSRRLIGNTMGDIYLKPYSVLTDSADSDRKYLVQSFEQQAKLNEYNVDLYELKDSEVVSAFGRAFVRAEFGSAFS
jgi:hypothetical protein